MYGLDDIFVKYTERRCFPGNQLRQSILNVRGDSSNVVQKECGMSLSGSNKLPYVTLDLLSRKGGNVRVNDRTEIRCKSSFSGSRSPLE